MRRRRVYAIIGASAMLGVVLVAASCNGETRGTAPGAEDSGLDGNSASVGACVPGQQISCACNDAPPGVQVCNDDGSRYGPCSCVGGPTSFDAGIGSPGDAPSDASMHDGTVWWSDAGTCPVVANRCDSTSDAAPDVISKDMLFADCICGPGADYSTCIGLNGSNLLPYCTAYCVANNPGFEQYTSCRIEGGAFGFGFQCECSHP